MYLDYLLQVHKSVTKLGRTMMYWADIVKDFDGLCHAQHHGSGMFMLDAAAVYDELPRDAIALEWGYEDTHDFDRPAANLAAHGIPFIACPGTSSWNSIVGRTANAISNIKSAAFAAVKHRALGLLVGLDRRSFDPIRNTLHAAHGLGRQRPHAAVAFFAAVAGHGSWVFVEHSHTGLSSPLTEMWL